MDGPGDEASDDEKEETSDAPAATTEGADDTAADGESSQAPAADDATKESDVTNEAPATGDDDKVETEADAQPEVKEEEKPEMAAKAKAEGSDAPSAVSRLDKVPPMEPALEEDEDTNDAMEQGASAPATDDVEPKAEPMDQSSANVEPKIEADTETPEDNKPTDMGEFPFPNTRPCT